VSKHPSPPKTERLQKYLAYAGVASRRASEKLIAQGRVKVNGQIVTEMGVKIDPHKDTIFVDGKKVTGRHSPPLYIMLNKPPYVLSTTEDDRGRKTVLDLVALEERLYPVGRLDYFSEGLILLTNDGELAQKLSHPAYGHEREYLVFLGGGPLNTPTLYRWRKGGFEVDGKTVGPMQIQPYSNRGPGWYRITLTEGRKRQIRVVGDLLGHPVQTLIRVRFGPLQLGNLRSGAWRHLSSKEVQRLKQPVRPGRKSYKARG
jgi:23S rRNA pseudouridine2605 synthase